MKYIEGGGGLCDKCFSLEGIATSSGSVGLHFAPMGKP